jgi:hypothetical protein
MEGAQYCGAITSIISAPDSKDNYICICMWSFVGPGADRIAFADRVTCCLSGNAWIAAPSRRQDGWTRTTFHRTDRAEITMEVLPGKDMLGGVVIIVTPPR